jgi:hypothetical protein
MTFQIGLALTNTRAGAIVTAAAGGALRLYSQVKPAACSTAEPGTAIATGTLPSPALANSGGTVSKAGVWTATGASGAGAGTAVQSFRVYDSGGTVCIMQGTVTGTGGGGDMTMNNVSIANGQVATVSSYGVDDTGNL